MKELVIPLIPVLLVGGYMLTRRSLFKAGCVFLAATAVTVLIVYMSFGGMAPAAAAAEQRAVAEEEDNMLAEAMQVNTIVESSECTRLLHLTRKRLLKSSPKSYERAVKLLVNHHFMQNILNILEQCPIQADERYRAALELLVVILCDSTSQSEYVQSTAAIVSDLKRMVQCFHHLADWKAAVFDLQSFPSREDEKLFVAALRCLVALAINCPEFREFLSDKGTIRIAQSLGLRPSLSSNAAVVLWTVRCTAVMTIQHWGNKEELFRGKAFESIRDVLDTFAEDKEIVRYTLLTLFNMLDDQGGGGHLAAGKRYSCAEARQRCLLLGLTDRILQCETRFADDRDIANTARSVGQYLYSNFS